MKNNIDAINFLCEYFKNDIPLMYTSTLIEYEPDIDSEVLYYPYTSDDNNYLELAVLWGRKDIIKKIVKCFHLREKDILDLLGKDLYEEYKNIIAE